MSHKIGEMCKIRYIEIRNPNPSELILAVILGKFEDIFANDRPKDKNNQT